MSVATARAGRHAVERRCVSRAVERRRSGARRRIQLLAHLRARAGTGWHSWPAGGRRCIARGRGDDRYFTLYELEALAALAGAEYADVVEQPTAWSLDMRPSLRNFQRHPCTTLVSLGDGIAGAIATFRLSLQGAASDPLSVAAKAILEPLLDTAGVTSIHLGVVDPDAAFPLQKASTTGAESDNSRHVLLVEGTSRDELDAAALRIAAAITPRLAANRGIQWNTYDLAFAIERADLRHSTARRQPPRPDLRAPWR